MGIEYNLKDLEKKREDIELKFSLAPRHACMYYVGGNGGKATLITRKEFDEHVDNDGFIDGPFRDCFGDGHGEPYNPHKQAYGVLRDKSVVYCELSEFNQKKFEEMLKKLEK